MAEHYLGIDTGGTFTDFVYLHQGNIVTFKTLSTPEAPERAIVQGISALGLDQLCKEGALSIVHGTTVATNAALESRGVKTAYITNEGLADVLAIGRQNRSKLFDLSPKKATLSLRPEATFEVPARRGPKGEIRKPLLEPDLRALIAAVDAYHPTAVAINLLYSFLSPDDENKISDCLGPSYFVSRSSEVLPEMGEYERGVATYLNASLGPLIEQYLIQLAEHTAPSSLAVMQSSGVTLDAEQAASQAIRLLLSGPAGGIIGAQTLLNRSQLMTFDMGGTSTDVGLIDGELTIATSMKINDIPIAIPAIDIKTIGAGGGSIAFIDDGGLLQVGPDSAGANPGPACYDLGGSKATVTDANVLLGRLPIHRPLAGGLRLSHTAAAESVGALAEQLGLSLLDTALGIVRLANEKMTEALRLISVQKGIDPKGFALCCFGGAGGLHLCDLADNLEIERAIVPSEAGVFSALGMLAARPGRELSMAFAAGTTEVTRTELNQGFERLIASGSSALGAEGVRPERVQKTLDLRYQGQTHALGVTFKGTLASAKKDFVSLHKKRYGHSLSSHIEVVTLRVRLEAQSLLSHSSAIPKGATKTEDFAASSADGIQPGLREIPWRDRATLTLGECYSGPLIVSDEHTSIWVKPGWTIESASSGILELRRATVSPSLRESPHGSNSTGSV